MIKKDDLQAAVTSEQNMQQQQIRTILEFFDTEDQYRKDITNLLEMNNSVFTMIESKIKENISNYKREEKTLVTIRDYILLMIKVITPLVDFSQTHFNLSDLHHLSFSQKQKVAISTERKKLKKIDDIVEQTEQMKPEMLNKIIGKLAYIFVNNVQLLVTIYSNYFEKYECIVNTKKLIEGKANKDPFLAYFLTLLKDPSTKLNFDDSIIKPVQRFPRYELLIKSLLTNIPQKDNIILHAKVDLALEHIKLINVTINKVNNGDKQNIISSIKEKTRLLTNLLAEEARYAAHQKIIEHIPIKHAYSEKNSNQAWENLKQLIEQCHQRKQLYSTSSSTTNLESSNLSNGFEQKNVHHTPPQHQLPPIPKDAHVRKRSSSDSVLSSTQTPASTSTKSRPPQRAIPPIPQTNPADMLFSMTRQKSNSNPDLPVQIESAILIKSNSPQKSILTIPDVAVGSNSNSLLSVQCKPASLIKPTTLPQRPLPPPPVTLATKNITGTTSTLPLTPPTKSIQQAQQQRLPLQKK